MDMHIQYKIRYVYSCPVLKMNVQDNYGTYRTVQSVIIHSVPKKVPPNSWR